jgi:hypothetical protein
MGVKPQSNFRENTPLWRLSRYYQSIQYRLHIYLESGEGDPAVLIKEALEYIGPFRTEKEIQDQAEVDAHWATFRDVDRK